MALTGTLLINGDYGVRVTLIDSAKQAWSDAELLGYLNVALRATATAKPDTYTVRDTVALDAGHLQQIPAGGIALIDIYANVQSSGSRGRIVTQVDASLLEEASRFWPAGTQQQEVEHFTADPRDPRRYQCYPPNDGTGAVEMLYGAVPTALTALTDSLPVSDTYETPLKYHMLHQAYAKNSKRQDLTKSSFYLQQWGQLLGLKSKSQIGVAPKVAESPGLA